MVTVQGPAPVQAPPQPAKVDPPAGLAVSVTELAVGKAAVQVFPQLMPLGALVTVPDRDPILCTLRLDMGTGPVAVKIAVRL
jgi:hypothetical protein